MTLQPIGLRSMWRCPLCDAIQRTLRAFLDGSDTQITEMQAEVAAALLVDCTSTKTYTKYETIDIQTIAVKRDLWNLAIAAVDKMIASDWPSKWDEPKDKLAVLVELRGDLQVGDAEASGIRDYLRKAGVL